MPSNCVGKVGAHHNNTTLYHFVHYIIAITILYFNGLIQLQLYKIKQWKCTCTYPIRNCFTFVCINHYLSLNRLLGLPPMICHTLAAFELLMLMKK